MQTIHRSVVIAVHLAVGSMLAQGSALAQTVNPQDLGIVEAPTAGSVELDLDSVPLIVIHAAKVAFKHYDGGATLTSAQIDKDDVLAVYEIVGKTSEGRFLEADIRADGVMVELEIEIGEGQLPPEVQQALGTFAPNFTPSGDRPRIEKSVRPSDVGLPEIWYEFSGSNFDVEVRSDGKAILIEPA